MSRSEELAPRWRRYLRFLRPDAAGDVDAELEFHLAMRAERNVTLGMSQDDAHRDAVARFGDMALVRDQLLDHERRRNASRQRMEFMSQFFQDLRFGFRSLRRAPGFSAAAILTLALGIGANAAIYSVIDAILIRPLPFSQPERLVAIGYGSAGELMALRERIRSFPQIGAVSPQAHPINVGDVSLRIEGAAVTPNVFGILGVAPLMGRVFTDDEAVPGRNTSLIISHSLWRSQFGGDAAIVGRTVSVEGTPFTIVGVMPPSFSFPHSDAQYWQPYALDPGNRGAHWGIGGKTFIGRLGPGVSLEQAQREVASVWPSLRTANPLWDPGEAYRRDTRIQPLQSEIVGSAGSLLWLLFGCVGLVLLIGCINVANLLLARATARERELSVRAALGGGRGRLVRQLITESLLLAIAGAAFGVLVALAGVKWLVSVMPAGVPRADAIAVNANVLVFTAVTAVATALMFGIVPALRATRFRTNIMGASRRATADSSHHRASGLLVAGEIALALVVVIASMLLVRSFSALRGVDPGFDATSVVAARISPPAMAYSEPARIEGFYNSLLERVGATPGVQHAAVVDKLPLAQTVWGMAVRIEGQHEDMTRTLPEIAHVQGVSSSYFDAMRVRVIRGRAFTQQDRDGQPAVALVSESVARRFWPDGDAIGKRVGYPFPSPWITIVGIVPDTKQDSLREASSATLYLPWAQRLSSRSSEMWLVARTNTDPGAMARSIRTEVAAIDGMVAVSDVRSMDDVVAVSLERARFATLLVTLFAAAALALGIIGIYGVMSYVVSQRSQEMGIRLALGSTPGQVLALVVRRGALLAGAGVAAGLVAAAFATRWLSAMLYGVTATDPVTFLAVPIVLLAIAMAASMLPGLRATRVDPVTSLRSD